MTTFREMMEEEIDRNDLLERKAFGVDYYLSRGYRHEPSGSRLNETAWTCDGCERLRYYPALKYRSAKDSRELIFVCADCKKDHGYNDDPKDTRGSLLYWHKEWELKYQSINGVRFIMPRLIRQIHEYPIYADLKQLLWVRSKMSKSTLGNPSSGHKILSEIIERLRMNYVPELNKEEATCVLSNLLSTNRIDAWQCYVPNDLLEHSGLPLESLWDKYPFPDLNHSTLEITFKLYDYRLPNANKISSLPSVER